MAEFKAEVLNNFVRENNVQTVIEFGCGDGNQLTLADYPRYIGFDVSEDALAQCRARFDADATKSFKAMGQYDGERAELTLSLDVVYHLVEDEVYEQYMSRLFDTSDAFVIVYSSNSDANPANQLPHVRHRMFTRWVEANRPKWTLRQHLPNRYPLVDDHQTQSFAEFFVFERAASS